MENPFVVIYGKDQEELIDQLLIEFEKAHPGELISHTKADIVHPIDEIDQDAVEYTFHFKNSYSIYYWGYLQGNWQYKTGNKISYRLNW